MSYQHPYAQQQQPPLASPYNAPPYAGGGPPNPALPVYLPGMGAMPPPQHQPQPQPALPQSYPVGTAPPPGPHGYPANNVNYNSLPAPYPPYANNAGQAFQQPGQPPPSTAQFQPPPLPQQQPYGSPNPYYANTIPPPAGPLPTHNFIPPLQQAPPSPMYQHPQQPPSVPPSGYNTFPHGPSSRPPHPLGMHPLQPQHQQTHPATLGVQLDAFGLPMVSGDIAVPYAEKFRVEEKIVSPTRDSFTIYDQSGNIRYKVDGLFSINERKIMKDVNNQVLLKLKEARMKLRDRITVYNVHNVPLLTLQKASAIQIGSKRVNGYLGGKVSGSPNLVITGNHNNTRFHVLNSTNVEIADISRRKYSLKNVLTDQDTYDVTINHGCPALLCFITVAIDEIYED